MLSCEYSEGMLFTIIGFHICRGDRPGGHFLQSEAWEATKCAIESTDRCIASVVENQDGVL